MKNIINFLFKPFNYKFMIQLLFIHFNYFHLYRYFIYIAQKKPTETGQLYGRSFFKKLIK